MTKIIYGSEIALELKEEMHKQIEQIKMLGKRVPTLAVVLVGENPASVSYVKGKEKACAEIGMQSRLIRLPEETTQIQLNALIYQLNQDNDVDGILVQLPLPAHLNGVEVIHAIDPEKDVDGLHPLNVGRLYLKESGFIPCTPLGIMEILKRMELDLEGKNAVVLGRSNLVGSPIAQLLINANATVTVCHSRTNKIEEICRQADILIVAIGKPCLVKKDWVKEGAYVIDVGVNRVDNKLCGDVDFGDVKDHVSAITPVPKGVGPMTIAMLLKNTLQAHTHHMQQKG